MSATNVQRVPHPFPYQGSKRRIARHILALIPSDAERLYEPFCGSAAVSLAAARYGWASSFALNDLNPALIALWREILDRPHDLVDQYGELWHEQQHDPRGFFVRVRTRFNQTHEPRDFLYLLARIVKGSIRYGADGRFNQSPDNRRLGMHPSRMRRQIEGSAALLSTRTVLTALDFRDALLNATPNDVIYMDPPYQGTSTARDRRYFSGLPFGEFADALAEMNTRELSYIVSYDGRTGTRAHGERLPASLRLQHHEIDAGRSTQATLLGADEVTIESLYVSPALQARLADDAVSAPPLPTLALASSGAASD